MRVLFDITHPVHAYFFKYLINTLTHQGHQVLVTARDKDVTLAILKGLAIPHLCISKRSGKLWHALKELVVRTLRLFLAARQFRPDLFIAADAGVSVGPVGAAMGVPRLVFDQVDIAPLQQCLAKPWETLICTSHSYLKDFGRRHIRFRGLLAQAYLDPRRFRPDPEPIRQAGLDPSEPYIVLRLVRWAANHDLGKKGLTSQQLARIIKRLSRYGRVLISSEDPLPEPLKEYQNPVSVEHLHDLLAFAALCISEGGTVAPEAGILGTPAICYNPRRFALGYLRALEKDYELILCPASLSEAVNSAEKILRNGDIKKQWLKRRDRFFEQTDDVGDFMRQMVDYAINRKSQVSRPIGYMSEETG